VLGGRDIGLSFILEVGETQELRTGDGTITGPGPPKRRVGGACECRHDFQKRRGSWHHPSNNHRNVGNRSEMKNPIINLVLGVLTRATLVTKEIVFRFSDAKLYCLIITLYIQTD